MLKKIERKLLFLCEAEPNFFCGGAKFPRRKRWLVATGSPSCSASFDHRREHPGIQAKQDLLTLLEKKGHLVIEVAVLSCC